MKSAVTILVTCVTGLMALGMVMLYSSGMFKGGAQYFLMQLIWGVVGLVSCVIAASLDYRRYRKFVWVVYGAALVLLVLVFVPGIGAPAKGASRWLRLGSVRFQPSELAKLALIMVLAWYGERYQRQMSGWKRGVFIPGLIIGAALALIFPEPDRGTTILLAAVSGIMLLIAGVRWVYFVPPVVAGVGALAVSLWHDPLRSGRIVSWLYLEEHKSGVGYQAYQAMLALGAGGWTGLGLGNGKQKLGFIPDHHTDFIFSVIGEELGLVATLLVVAAFVAIIICGIYISSRASDPFGLLLGSGITFTIGLQAFINIGVVTSALPNKGISLPFISYGGSSLLLMLTAVGVLLSIARHGRAPDLILERTEEQAHLAPADNPFKLKPRPAHA